MAKTAAVKASKKPLKKRIWDQRYLFLLMVPAIIWVAVICYGEYPKVCVNLQTDVR